MNVEAKIMSDLAATGCCNDCGCNGNNWWWIIILILLAGGFSNNGCGCDNGCGCN